VPRKIVDLSARSEIIRDEPFHLHFWECEPREYLQFLRDPRTHLAKIGIVIPEDCRIETTIENHDWLGAATNGLRAADGTIICNIGGGNVARTVYRITSYAHSHDSIGKFDKALLHAADEQSVPERRTRK
jgi:hypothetical protein